MKGLASMEGGTGHMSVGGGMGHVSVGGGMGHASTGRGTGHAGMGRGTERAGAGGGKGAGWAQMGKGRLLPKGVPLGVPTCHHQYCSALGSCFIVWDVRFDIMYLHSCKVLRCVVVWD